MATDENEIRIFLELLNGDPVDSAYRTAFADWMESHGFDRFGWLRQSDWKSPGLDAVNSLLELLKSTSTHIYPLGEKLLAWIGEPAVAGVLSLGETGDDWVRGLAASTLSKMNRSVLLPHLPVLIRLGQQGNWPFFTLLPFGEDAVAVATALSVALKEDAAATIPAIARAVASGINETSLVGVIQEIGADPAVIQDRLIDMVFEGREDAVTTLALVGPKAFAAIFAEFNRNADSRRVESAVQAFTSAHALRFESWLFDVVQRESGAARHAAILALVKGPDPLFPVFEEGLFTSTGEFLRWYVFSLNEYVGLQRCPKAVAYLQKAINFPDTWFQTEICEVLAWQYGDYDSEHAPRMLEELYHAPEPASLTAHLKHAEPSKRVGILRHLGRLVEGGNRDARRYLVDALHDPHHQVRATATELLQHFPEPV